jgi:CRISPR-associated exonuclease Cas4
VAVAIAALVAALLLVILAGKRRLGHGGGMPRGRIVYQDGGPRTRPLVSPVHPLLGKPDYVVEVRRGVQVPVEYKSYPFGARPPHADLVQLGAYLLLLEDLAGRRPPYGVLRYSNRVVKVAFSRRLRTEVLATLAAVQQARDTPPRGNPSRALCRSCPFAPICPDRG